MTCTWVDCTSEAKHPQTAQDGEVWANLCDEHNNKIDGAMTERSAPKILSYWIKAQGGAKAAAARMTGAV